MRPADGQTASMGLDDVAKSAKEEVKEEKTEDLKDKLGVETEEDLEEYDERVGRIVDILVAHDKKVEDLEERLDRIEKQNSLIIQLLDKEGDSWRSTQ